MSDPKPALVLHVPSSAQPLMFALSAEQAAEMRTELRHLMVAGEPKSITLADESTAVINFAHVVSAHVDEVPPLASVYGDPQRKRSGGRGES